MANKVGTKGQVVIEKEIRDQLGVRPGSVAIQRVVDDHVEIYFVPAPHRRSLLGCLAKYTTVRIPPGEEWDKAREKAWEYAAREEMGLEEPAP